MVARFLRAVAVVSAFAAMSCSGGGYTVVVRFATATLTDQAREVEVSLVQACSDQGIDRGAAPFGALRAIDLRRGRTGVGLGSVKPGSYGLYARAFDGACGVVGAGCKTVTLIAGGSAELVVPVDPVTGSYGCAADEQCVDGACLGPDAGTRDGGREGGLEGGTMDGSVEGGVDAGPRDAGPVCHCASCASCDEAGACVPNPSACGAGSYCDPLAGCTPGTPCSADGGACPASGNPCAPQSCDTTRTPPLCVPNLSSDGTPCTASGVDGQCRSGTCCTGCWSSGACVMGNTPAACGIGGALCTTCDDGNPCTTDTCESGRTCGAVTDDMATCPGGTCHEQSCCTGCWNGLSCVSGTGDSACGTGGVACMTCGGTCPTTSCMAGVCASPGVTVIGGEYDHRGVIAPDGHLFCWGHAIGGDIGDGSNNTNRSAPVPIGTAAWLSMAGGEVHSCGIQVDHSLWCWGENRWGQLGTGGTAAMNRPTRVGGGTDWAQVATGYTGTCAVKTDGSLHCWGQNRNGELGIGAPSATTPTRVGTDTDWASVATRTTHTCAVKTGGSLWCWGLNSSGELGIGTSTDAASPQQVGTGTGWAQVTVGTQTTLGAGTAVGFTCAIQTDGTLWCWGGNGNSIVAGTGTENLSPVQVGTATDWTQNLRGLSLRLRPPGCGHAVVLGAERPGAVRRAGGRHPSRRRPRSVRGPTGCR